MRTSSFYGANQVGDNVEGRHEGGGLGFLNRNIRRGMVERLTPETVKLQT